MRPGQWKAFRKAAKQEPAGTVPVAVLMDSAWLPGHLGIGHLDYYLDPEIWFQSNLKVAEEFPDVIFFPSWWMEYGMANEASALGSRIVFRSDKTPDPLPCLDRLEDAESLKPVNPSTDGLMAFAIHHYRAQKERIFDAGHVIPVVASRGPFVTAGSVRDVNQFMLDMIDKPKATHCLLDGITESIIRWLTAQAEAVGDCVDGILILDDIIGFVSEALYLEFAQPCLTRICEAFPKDWVKVFHNDANVRPFLQHLPATGFDVLNWTYNIPVTEARAKTGGRMCLMGNVNPLGIATQGTPEQVRLAAIEVLDNSAGEGLILSLGGGMSPGIPAANLRALAGAAGEWNRERPRDPALGRPRVR